ncbi:MAG: TadE/TadG family type IV pilus assembly protein [Bacilli bacterium]
MKNRRGQALIEFVLVLPILIMLLFSIIDFGTILVRKSQLENKINDAYEVAKSTADGVDLYEKIKSAVNEDSDIEIDVELVFSNDSDYMTIRLTSDVKTITPGLNLILGYPYKATAERVINYAQQ